MIRVFCDFDATISAIDVGNAMFQKFGTYNYWYQKFSGGEIDVRRLNVELCNSIDNTLGLKEIVDWAISNEIDAYFPLFVKFCNKNEIFCCIVSDGYDVYIEPLLTKNNICIPVFCNKLQKNDDKFEPLFFNLQEHCKCFTSSCKRDVLLNNSSDDDVIIYIGDGYTDFCPAKYADIVFAKSKLATFCNENRISHYNFKSFFDIIQIMKKILQKNIKHKNYSFNLRKSAFIDE